MEWSLILYVYIKDLSDGMGINFLNVCIDVVSFLACMKLVFLSFLIFYYGDMKMTFFLYHLVRSKKRGAAINFQFCPTE